MKRRFKITAFLATALLSLTAFSYAQTVRILDDASRRPIEKVRVTDGVQSATSNSNGEVDISDFQRDKPIVFSHPHYITYETSFDSLKSAEFTIALKAGIPSFSVVVTSVYRREQEAGEIPNKVIQITESETELNNPQTTADLLGASDQVYVQKSQLGGGSPMIRGFSANRVLLVVDGVRMNNAIFRSGNLQNVISLDANSIDTAEVIFGPGSVIYGSDAIGGVMDFHTLTPELSNEDALQHSADLMARYSSANTERTGHFDLNIGHRKWSFLTSATFSDYGDLRMGSRGRDDYMRREYVTSSGGDDWIVSNDNPNLQKFSGYNQVNLMNKLRFAPDESWEINYGFHYSRSSDTPRYDRLIEKRGGLLRYAEWYYGPQRWMMNALNVKNAGGNSLFDVANLTIAHQFFEESRNDRKFGDEELTSRVEQINAISLNLDFDKSLSENHTLFYGAEVVTNSISSTAEINNIASGEKESTSTRYPDGSKWSSYAAYLNLKSDISDKLTLLSGARYNRVVLDAAFDKTYFPFPFDNIHINTGALTGSLGLVYHPTPSWQFNFNASTGFRAPNIDDAAKVFDSEPGAVVIPNEDLESEYVWNIDLGLVRWIGGRARIEATGFYALLDNVMVRRDFQFGGQEFILYDGELSRVQAIQNADSATVYGTQLGIVANLGGNLLFRSNVTLTRGKTSNGEPERHVPPTFGSTHLHYSSAKLDADLYLNFNSAIPYERLAPSESGKPHIYAADADGNPFSPAWWTLNFKAGYQLNETLQLNVGLENITDQRYRPYSSGIAAAGRNLIIGLRAGF